MVFDFRTPRVWLTPEEGHQPVELTEITLAPDETFILNFINDSYYYQPPHWPYLEPDNMPPNPPPWPGYIYPPEGVRPDELRYYGFGYASGFAFGMALVTEEEYLHGNRSLWPYLGYPPDAVIPWEDWIATSTNETSTSWSVNQSNTDAPPPEGWVVAAGWNWYLEGSINDQLLTAKVKNGVKSGVYYLVWQKVTSENYPNVVSYDYPFAVKVTIRPSPDKAVNVSPTSGSEEVATNAAVQWRDPSWDRGNRTEYFKLYLGTTSALDQSGDYKGRIDALPFEQQQLGSGGFASAAHAILNSGLFLYGHTYYWRIDSFLTYVDGNGDTQEVKTTGDTWVFIVFVPDVPVDPRPDIPDPDNGGWDPITQTWTLGAAGGGRFNEHLVILSHRQVYYT